MTKKSSLTGLKHNMVIQMAKMRPKGLQLADLGEKNVILSGEVCENGNNAGGTIWQTRNSDSTSKLLCVVQLVI